MACAPQEKPGEKRGISSLLNDIDVSDTSSNSITDDDSFSDESLQETQEETTVSTLKLCIASSCIFTLCRKGYIGMGG